jgi:hypothetical protein
LVWQLGARQETSADPAKLLAPDVRIVRASHPSQTFLDMCSFFGIPHITTMLNCNRNVSIKLFSWWLRISFLQTDQKLRVCDICGAFLSIYDK